MVSKVAESAPIGLGVAPIGLCLEFVNTEGVERNSPPDRLAGLDLFFEWAVDRQVLDRADVARLVDAAGDVRDRVRFLDSARELREALYRIFSAQAEGRDPTLADTAILDRYLVAALPTLRLVQRAGEFRWIRPDPPRCPAELLDPIALSAADLLRSTRLERVKECAGDTCSWMFIDESRNRSRRWCDMSDCGNRAKARRYYRRHSAEKR